MRRQVDEEAESAKKDVHRGGGWSVRAAGEDVAGEDEVGE